MGYMLFFATIHDINRKLDFAFKRNFIFAHLKIFITIYQLIHAMYES